MWLLNPYRFGTGYDGDAAAYIAAVEAADGQTLETGVKDAINAFVIGCKADGIWTAIKASCIMAGARTLSGALVPLVGTAPTRLGTEAGWSYIRKDGLRGNGTDNKIDSGRSNSADPQDSKHLSFYRTVASSVVNRAEISYSGGNATAGASSLGRIGTTSTSFRINTNSSTALNSILGAVALGFCGGSRSSSSSISYLYADSSGTYSVASQTPASDNLYLLADAQQTTACNARIAYYSIGESLDLALLDARVTTLVNAIAAAIP